MHSLLQDVRYGLRILAKTPAVTAVAILTLALGIGATSAIFTFVNAALVRSLPYQHPEQLIHLTQTKRGDYGDMPVAYPNYLDWKSQNTVFESMTMWANDGGTFTGHDGPRLVQEGMVSGNFFAVLGVNAVLGRTFVPEDEQKTPHAIVVSYAFWQQQLGGDPNIAGKAIPLSNSNGVNDSTVLGVLPRDFEFAPLGQVEAFDLPAGTGSQFTRRNLHWLDVLARLKPGVTIQQAQANMDAIAAHLAQLYAVSNAETGVRLETLHDSVIGKIRPVLLLVFASAGFVLLIACANIANVLLAKAAARTREVMVRFALGASRARLARQFLTESVVLALVGGACGILVGRWGVAALAGMVPAAVRPSMPFLGHLGVSAPALAFTAALSLLTGVLFGLAPALRATPTSLHAALGQDSRSSVGGRRHMRDALVVAEVAVAATLLVGAGLLSESLWRVAHADPGFNRHNLLTMRYQFPAFGQPDAQGNNPVGAAKTTELTREALRQIGVLPGVQGVGTTSVAPLACESCNTARFRMDNDPLPTSAAQPEGSIRDISENYFDVLQAQLLRGRYFTGQDDPAHPPVIIVNRTLEKEFFQGDAIGHTLTFTCCPNLKPREIVGVIADVDEGQLDSPQRPAMYTPVFAGINSGGTLVIRTAGDPAQVAGPARSVLQGLDPRTLVYRVSSEDAMVANSYSMFLRRLPAMLVAAFASLAILLAAIGIYGVISYGVAQRTREFGVRMALGATARDLVRLVLRAGVRLTLFGLGLGVLAAAGLGRIAASFLFGVRPLDGVAFFAAVALVSAVALGATLLPALRAGRLDPVDALRVE